MRVEAEINDSMGHFVLIDKNITEVPNGYRVVREGLVRKGDLAWGCC